MTNDELEACITGGLWKTSSVEETPVVSMGRWSVRQTETGDRHIVGYNITEGEGRVSSKIASFDKETMVATTRKGRKYELRRHDSGVNMDSEYVWQAWCRINEVEDWTDVTEQYEDPRDIS
jgi:hypothetical protein